MNIRFKLMDTKDPVLQQFQILETHAVSNPNMVQGTTYLCTILVPICIRCPALFDLACSPATQVTNIEVTTTNSLFSQIAYRGREKEGREGERERRQKEGGSSGEVCT